MNVSKIWSPIEQAEGKPNYEKKHRRLVGFGNGISCG